MIRKLLGLPLVYRTHAALFNTAEVHKELIKSAGYQPGMRLLDIGCGTGDLARLVLAEDYTGIDLSKPYIDSCRQRFSGEFHVMSADQVGELKSVYDIALICGLLHHLSDQQVRDTLRGLTRVLKPGGHLYLLEAVWPTSRLDLPGYFIRRMDRGEYVRSADDWHALLGESWQISEECVTRNRIIQYYQCKLLPPTTSTELREG